MDAMAGGTLTYSDTFKFNDNKVAIAKALLNEFHKTGDYPQQYMNAFRIKFPANSFQALTPGSGSERDKAERIIVGVMGLKNKQNILSQVFVGIELSGNQENTEQQFEAYAEREGTWDGTEGTWTPNPPTEPDPSTGQGDATDRAGEDVVETPVSPPPPPTAEKESGVGAPAGTVASERAKLEAQTALSGATRELSEVRTELSNAKANGAKLAGCLKQLEEVKGKVEALKAAKERFEEQQRGSGTITAEDQKDYDAHVALFADISENPDKYGLNTNALEQMSSTFLSALS